MPLQECTYVYILCGSIRWLSIRYGIERWWLPGVLLWQRLETLTLTLTLTLTIPWLLLRCYLILTRPWLLLLLRLCTLILTIPKLVAGRGLIWIWILKRPYGPTFVALCQLSDKLIEILLTIVQRLAQNQGYIHRQYDYQWLSHHFFLSVSHWSSKWFLLLLCLSLSLTQ